MPTETEAKMRIADPAPIAAVLARVGAVELGTSLERNTFFDTPDDSLKSADCGLRIRVARNLASAAFKCTITHKGPAQAGALKVREETEIVVDDPVQAERLLVCLGFVRRLSFEKRRRSFTLNGCRVELDELPRLGHFVEIEGPGEAAVLAVRRKLGLDSAELIKTPYIAMVAQTLSVGGEVELCFG